MQNQLSKPLLLAIIVLAGLCSLMYELLISTTSSYLLGDSVKQFSLTIGVYMAAMGIGSFLSQYIKRDLLSWFVYIEILLGLVGGISVPLMYYSFNFLSLEEFQVLMLILTLIIGIFTGLEIPILVRFLKGYFPLKENIAYVLGLDYIGALFATLLFPFLLLPFLGTFKTALLFGIVNLIMGAIVYVFFIKKLGLQRTKVAESSLAVSLIGLMIMLLTSGSLLDQWEDKIFSHKVVYSKESQYQNLVMTKNRDDLRLYINNIIQFSSMDEYRYHEALAHVPLCFAKHKSRVLILGGGEGLLAREILKHTDVDSVHIVDLDAEVFAIASTQHDLVKLNQGALKNPKVKPIVNDAMQYLVQNSQLYDVIIADLPDPSNESLSRLYSKSFYKLIANNLSHDGIFVAQATSVYHTNKAFWCIEETLQQSPFLIVVPYHVYVPSFGDWGFVLASKMPLAVNDWPFCVREAKFLNADQWSKMLHFENDILKPKDIKASNIDDALLLKYFLEDWNKWSKELGTN
jgi:spermidine synthase